MTISACDLTTSSDGSRHSTNGALCLIIWATDLGVRDGLARILRELQAAQLSIEEIETVQIVFAEVLNNIVEHAYVGQSDGRIELTFDIQETDLHCHLRDTGLPMPDGKTPIAVSPDLSADLPDLQEGGFGWFMIHNLAKNVSYENIDGTNHLKFLISVGTG